MKSSIWKLYVVNFLTGVQFWYPIEKLFMRQIGLDSFMIAASATVFLIVTLLFDVPAGVLADRWKRTGTLILSLVALAIGTVIGGTSHGFVQYSISMAFFGLYVVLCSGTFQALMYDVLHDVGQEKHYDKYQGRSYALFLAGVGVSSLVGGYLAEWLGYPAVYFLSVIPSILAILVILSIREPRFHKPTQDRHYFRHISKGFAAIRQTPLMFHLGTFVVIAGLLRSTQNEYAGLYYIALGLTAIPTGYANAAKWLSGTLGQLLAPRVGRNILKFVPLLFIIFFGFTVFESRWGLVFFYAAVVLQAMMHNQAEAEIQSHISSDIRATTISSLSFMTNLLLVPLGLLFGWIANVYSVYRAYQLIAAVGLVYALVWIFRSDRQVRIIFTQKQPRILEPAEDLQVIK